MKYFIDPQWQIMRMTKCLVQLVEVEHAVHYHYTNDLVFAEVSVATSKTENDNTFWNYFGQFVLFKNYSERLAHLMMKHQRKL